MFNKVDLYYYNYINKLGNNFLFLHKNYLKHKFIMSLDVPQEKMKFKVFIFSMFLFWILYFNIDNAINLSSFLFLLFCYKMYIYKEKVYTKSEVIEHFYKEYKSNYDNICNSGEYKNFNKEDFEEYKKSILKLEEIVKSGIVDGKESIFVQDISFFSKFYLFFKLYN